MGDDRAQRHDEGPLAGDLEALRPSFDRIVRVAMTLFGAGDGEVIIRQRGFNWHSKGPANSNSSFFDLVTGAREVVWIEDLPNDPRLASRIEPALLSQIRFGAGAPIRLASGADIGVLVVVDAEIKPFDARLARRLQDLADLIADDWERHQALRARAQAEAEARAARATLSSIVECAPVALAMTDIEMRIVQVSPKWLEDRGFEAADVVGRSMYELFPGTDKTWSVGFNRALKGETIRGDRVQINRSDGRAAWIRSEHTPWRDARGEVGGLLLMSVDITDMVEALEETKRSEQRLKLAIDIGELNMWEMDFRRRELNGQGWTEGFSGAQDLDFNSMLRDSWFAVHPQDKPAAMALWDQHLADGTPFRATYRLLQPGAPHVWIQSATEAFRDENGEVIRVVGVVRNIDKQKRGELALANARDAAEAANRAKSEFLANMSHEIRTPLNGVMGVASALAQSDLAPAQQEMVGLIESSAQTLESLLSDVLDLARIEAGRMEIGCEPVDLRSVARDVGALFEPSAKAKGLSFCVEVAPAAAGLFQGDGARIRQVLSNLVSNAVKFTALGGIVIEVGALPGEGGTCVTFTVRDTGIGFGAAAGDRLFDRFEQADGSITRQFGGTGLGLAISRSLASAMGGSLEATSTPGLGSVFELRLTLAPVSASGAATAGRSAGGEAGDLSHFRVLLAEDHPTNRRVVELILGSAGVRLTSVENGAKAVEAWRPGAFDLILMDMQMPVMDGLSATRAIRAAEQAAGAAPTPIFSLTANAMPEHAKASREAGADGHLTKPITADALLGAVRDAADGIAPKARQRA